MTHLPPKHRAAGEATKTMAKGQPKDEISSHADTVWLLIPTVLRPAIKGTSHKPREDQGDHSGS